jgi:hypothetical protein
MNNPPLYRGEGLLEKEVRGLYHGITVEMSLGLGKTLVEWKTI